VKGASVDCDYSSAGCVQESALKCLFRPKPGRMPYFCAFDREGVRLPLGSEDGILAAADVLVSIFTSSVCFFVA